MLDMFLFIRDAEVRGAHWVLGPRSRMVGWYKGHVTSAGGGSPGRRGVILLILGSISNSADPIVVWFFSFSLGSQSLRPNVAYFPALRF